MAGRTPTRKWFVIALVLVVGVVWALPSPGLAGGNSGNAKLCQKGGWRLLQKADGTPFSGQDDCVGYGATGGTIEPIPTATPTPTMTPVSTESPTPIPTPTLPVTPPPSPGPPTVFLVVFSSASPDHCDVFVEVSGFPSHSDVEVWIESRHFVTPTGGGWTQLAIDTIFADDLGHGLTMFTVEEREVRVVRAWGLVDQSESGFVVGPIESNHEFLECSP